MLPQKNPVNTQRKPLVYVPKRPQPVLERRLLAKSKQDSGKRTGKNGKIVGSIQDGAMSSDKDGTQSGDSNKRVLSNPMSNQYVSSNYENTNLSKEVATKHCPSTDLHPTLSRGVCDRLTITFGHRKLDTKDFDVALKDLTTRIEHYPYLGPVRPKKTAYLCNFRLRSSTGENLGLFQIRPKKPKNNFARLDINPAEIGEEGVAEVRQVLSMLFGQNFSSIISAGNITRFDAAADVLGVQIGDIIPYTVRPQQHLSIMRCFPKGRPEKWTLGSIYLGAEKSGRRYALYDKACQLLEVKGTWHDFAKSRIEMRLRPDKWHKKAKAVTLLQISNPLRDLQLGYFPSVVPDEFLQFFLLGVKEWGFMPAIGKISDEKKRAALRRTFAAYAVDWWNPEAVWDEVLDHIASLKLFDPKLL